MHLRLTRYWINLGILQEERWEILLEMECPWRFMPDRYLSRGVLWRNSIKKKYLYPGYANSMLTIKGLYIYEWMIAIGGLSVCMFVFSYIGLVYGLMWIGFVYIVCVRGGESRQNHLMQVISIIQFSLSQKIYIRREREDIELQKEKEEKKKKRKRKENKPKKKKNKEKRKEDAGSFSVFRNSRK